MPLIVESFRFTLPADLKTQLERVYRDSPEFTSGEAAVQALEQGVGAEGTLYTGIFNAKPVCAMLVQGPASQRQLRYLAVHPANRGRGSARRLFDEVRRLEAAGGAKSLEALFDLRLKGIPGMLDALGFEREGDSYRLPL